MEIAAFQSLTKGSSQTEKIRMNGLFLLVINSQRLLPTRSFYFSAFKPKRSARSHRYVLPILHLERRQRNQPHTLYPISVILRSRLLVLSLFPRYPPLTPHLEDWLTKIKTHPVLSFPFWNSLEGFVTLWNSSNYLSEVLQIIFCNY